MQFGWQDLVALIVVALATGYLARRTWRVLGGSKSGGCGTCSSCDTNDAKQSGNIISIESLVESGKK
jgi:hypothetical protein